MGIGFLFSNLTSFGKGIEITNGILSDRYQNDIHSHTAVTKENSVIFMNALNENFTNNHIAKIYFVLV